MTEREFCFWLDGFFDISNGEYELSYEQMDIIKKKLKDILYKTNTVNYFPTTSGLFTVKSATGINENFIQGT